VGIRADAPNQLWHIDVTIIRLLDGTKAYLHAVIDNFSRRILAWALEERLGASGTCRILLEAGRHLGTRPVETTVVADSGTETMPHAAFHGQTPDEIYFGNGDAVVIDLATARVRARQERMKANRMAGCGVCAGDPDSDALQLPRAKCGMS
jgi:transposase InsO family protein